MSHDFEVVGSELLLDAPIIAVRRDEVVMPGGTTAFREVVEHFGAVAIVAIDDAERIAMVHQYRRSVDRRLWELPAGLLDIKGEDELTGARRELQEEAGLAAQDWSVLADIITSPGFCEEAVRVFLARDLSEAPRLAAEGTRKQTWALLGWRLTMPSTKSSPVRSPTPLRVREFLPRTRCCEVVEPRAALTSLSNFVQSRWRGVD